MNKAPLIFAKLAALYKELQGRLDRARGYSRVSTEYLEYFDRYFIIRDQLRKELPDLYADLPIRKAPTPTSVGDIYTLQLDQLVRDMDYVFEVKANAELKFDAIVEDPPSEARPMRAFISHGRSPDWREVQDYVEKDLKIDTLELAQEPNKGRTVLQKLNEESDACSFAVVVMTGDDDIGIGAPRARENVMHEIGFFQGKYGLANVCLLHEEGTNIPSNIHGLVYIPFPKGLVSASFGVLGRELRTAFPTT
ncbi:MAG TPA: nucleotide-binding protein [Pyrinomonadaceae bacterium]|nr:nucleotide-binding protein [Pyrinomonadaceae bacterium]